MNPFSRLTASFYGGSSSGSSHSSDTTTTTYIDSSFEPTPPPSSKQQDDHGRLPDHAGTEEEWEWELVEGPRSPTAIRVVDLSPSGTIAGSEPETARMAVPNTVTASTRNGPASARRRRGPLRISVVPIQTYKAEATPLLANGDDDALIGEEGAAAAATTARSARAPASSELSSSTWSGGGMGLVRVRGEHAANFVGIVVRVLARLVARGRKGFIGGGVVRAGRRQVEVEPSPPPPLKPPSRPVMPRSDASSGRTSSPQPSAYGATTADSTTEVGAPDLILAMPADGHDDHTTEEPCSPSETTPLKHHSYKRRARASSPGSASLTDSIRSGRSMSTTDSHDEPHFFGAEVVRDVIVGLSDGLTVPFALAAGLSSLNNSRIVVTAGMAEIVAGAISMGLGGYLAGRSEIEHYDAERRREVHEVLTMPRREEAEIVELFEPYGVGKNEVEPLLERLRADPEMWVDFMMKFELALERPDARRSWISAITIGFSYFMGGLVPLIPYMLFAEAEQAFHVSIVATLSVLLLFGYVKARLLGVQNAPLSALQMMLIGAAAAATAYFVAKVNHYSKYPIRDNI
ncbi:hypothetical protein HK101_010448 [Irineochytrium annulatum]|nr:hypothetical protein HK101_010448 [Irineochytrium annulatum]